MVAFFNFFTEVPSLKEFSLKNYSINLSLDKLNLGVDNIHFDVHLSPEFCKTTSKVMLRLIAKHFKTSNAPDLCKNFDWFRERNEFKKLCLDVLRDAINKAKLAHEIQIDYLAQIAIIELFIKEIGKQYEACKQNFKNVIRKHEADQNQNMTIKLKEELSQIMQNKKSIYREVSIDIFKCLSEVQEGLNELRAVNFGKEAILPDEFFSNPLLHVENPSNDIFMMEEYILLGHRIEDPNRYETIFYLINGLLCDLYQNSFGSQEIANQSTITSIESNEFHDTHNEIVNNLIKEVDNVDTLLNYFHTWNLYKKLKKQKENKKRASKIKAESKRAESSFKFVSQEI